MTQANSHREITEAIEPSTDMGHMYSSHQIELRDLDARLRNQQKAMRAASQNGDTAEVERIAEQSRPDYETLLDKCKDTDSVVHTMDPYSTEPLVPTLEARPEQPAEPSETKAPRREVTASGTTLAVGESAIVDIESIDGTTKQVEIKVTEISKAPASDFRGVDMDEKLKQVYYVRSVVSPVDPEAVLYSGESRPDFEWTVTEGTRHGEVTIVSFDKCRSRLSDDERSMDACLMIGLADDKGNVESVTLDEVGDTEDLPEITWRR